MAHKVFDLAQQLTTGTGTGALPLGAVPSGCIGFADQGAVAGDTFWGCIRHLTANEVEVTLCTIVGDGTITRAATPLISTTGAKIAFSAGTKTITCVAPGSKSIVMDNNGDALVTGAFAAAVVNATSIYQFNGSAVLSRGGGFTIIYENAGAPSLLLAASSNYYQSAEHIFRDDDQTTVRATLNGTGLRLGAGAPAKQLHLYGSDNSLQILQKLQNYNAGTPIAAIGFDVTAFGETEVCKAAIGFTRNNAQGVGDYVFLLRNNTDTAEVTAANEVLRIQAAGHVLPGADNAQNLGSGSLRYGTVYAGTGAINTSGRAAKAFIGDAIDAERRAARRILDIGPRRYKLAEAVEKKGDAARWHFGYVAEDVRDALAAEGLDPWTYGFMCRDRVLANERYTETESRPKTRKVKDYENVVEVRDGKPVRIRKAVERDDPVGTMRPVYDEGGAPVMVEVRNAQGALALAPMLHFVPEMEEVEVECVRQVDTGVDRLGLRYSELEAFLRCAA
ncbi:MAG: hypothetical protein FD144_4760 [Rhodospirillaceae bacterium]|nr:MAG: hypothetical protein FD144_4760 [Rhodospirillaceae bacterium]